MELEAAGSNSFVRSNVDSIGDNSVPTKSLSEQGRVFPKGPAKHCLSGHRSAVTAIACHPLYTIFASSSDDFTVRLWDIESGSYRLLYLKVMVSFMLFCTGQFERSLKGHTAAVTAVAFEPNKGDILVTASEDLTAKLWSMQSYSCTKTLRGHDHTISDIEFLPLGSIKTSYCHSNCDI